MKVTVRQLVVVSQPGVSVTAFSCSPHRREQEEKDLMNILRLLKGINGPYLMSRLQLANVVRACVSECHC